MFEQPFSVRALWASVQAGSLQRHHQKYCTRPDCRSAGLFFDAFMGLISLLADSSDTLYLRHLIRLYADRGRRM